jgi:glycosyltransferase involved in cell wall biosynthesis
MGRAVVTTHSAAEGVDGAAVDHELIAATEEQAFAAAVVQLLQHPEEAEAMGAHARARVLRDYDWTANLARLDALIGAGGRAGAAAGSGAMVAP